MKILYSHDIDNTENIDEEDVDDDDDVVPRQFPICFPTLIFI